MGKFRESESEGKRFNQDYEEWERLDMGLNHYAGEDDDDAEYDEEEGKMAIRSSPSGPNPRNIMIEFMDEVIRKAHLNRTQLNAIILVRSGMTQADIAKKLKKTQQAISKAMDTAQAKIETASKELGGGHSRTQFQAMHWYRTNKSQSSQ